MNEESWQLVDEVSGEAQAEILRGLLEAQGIQVLLSREGISHFAFNVSVGPLANVQILVPSTQAEAARAILEDSRMGRFENDGADLPAEDIPPEDQG